LTVSNILKYIFLIYFIICLIFGVLFFVAVEYAATLMAWPFLDPVVGRIMGSMFLGWAFGSLFAYRATEWSEVKAFVVANMVWCLFATVTFVWMMAVHATLPLLVTGFFIFLTALFFILFLYAYYTHN
jgi:hypothetical protein